ncbi:MAG: ABC transporter ATP-binding protein [Actinomycetota bacterium]
MAGRHPRTDDRPGLFLRGVRLVGSYIRAHPKPFAIAVAGAFVFAVASVAVSVALGRVTDRVLRPAFDHQVPVGALWLGVGSILGLASLRAVSIMVRRYYSGVAGAAVAASLRAAVADRYRQLSFDYHRTTPTGELLSHMEADVEASVDVYFPVPFSIGALLLAILALVSLLLADPFLALVGLFVVPLMVVMNRSFAHRMEEPATRTLERISDVSAIAHESVDGSLIVKSLGRERAEAGRFRERAEQLRDARVDAGFLRASFEPALQALPSLAVIVMLAVGSWRVSKGSITLGTLVQVVTLFGLLAWPMRFVGWILSQLPRAVVAHDRITAVLEHPVRVRPPDSPIVLPDGPLSVRVDSVSFTIDGARVLEDVSFEVGPEEAVALVGSTGAGKSTLAQLLVRLDDPTEGAVRLGGVDLREAEPGSLRRSAAIVFQESFLFTTTIRENIALDSGASPDEVRWASGIAQAAEFVDRLPGGYDTVVGERGHTLSGGERQRIAIARALVRHPRLLILDDATSAVDPSVEARIAAALRRELRTTLIVVAYRLGPIRMADRVLFLEDGRLRASGPHERLLDAERGYAAMVRAYERTAS